MKIATTKNPLSLDIDIHIEGDHNSIIYRISPDMRSTGGDRITAFSTVNGENEMILIQEYTDEHEIQFMREFVNVLVKILKDPLQLTTLQDK
jgi:hypothetical protein